MSPQGGAFASLSNFFKGFQSEFLPWKSKEIPDFRLYIYSSIKVYKNTFVFNLVFLYEMSSLSKQAGVFAFISNIFKGFKSEFFPQKSKEIPNFVFIYTRLSKSTKIPLFLIQYFCMKCHLWAYKGDPLHSFLIFSRVSKVNFFNWKSKEIPNFVFIYTRLSKSIKLPLFLI